MGSFFQQTTFQYWRKINADAEIVESPTLQFNEGYGEDVLYFTARFNRTYIEYGIRLNGDIFVVR